MERAPDVTGAMRPEEARRFMALLIHAQSTKHKCAFCKYFKTVA